MFPLAQSALSAAQSFKLRLLCPCFFIISAILSLMFIVIISLSASYLLFLFFILLHLTSQLVSKSLWHLLILRNKCGNTGNLTAFYQLKIIDLEEIAVCLTLRLLMSYIYMEHLFLMFLDHTQRRTTVGRTPLDE